jgi:carbonic anhydrase
MPPKQDKRNKQPLVSKDPAPSSLITSVLITCLVLAVTRIRVLLTQTEPPLLALGLTVLAVVGLTFCFIWRRIPSSPLKTTANILYLLSLWTYLIGHSLPADALPEQTSAIGVTGFIALGLACFCLIIAWLRHQLNNAAVGLISLGGAVVAGLLLLQIGQQRVPFESFQSADSEVPGSSGTVISASDYEAEISATPTPAYQSIEHDSAGPVATPQTHRQDIKQQTSGPVMGATVARPESPRKSQPIPPRSQSHAPQSPEIEHIPPPKQVDNQSQSVSPQPKTQPKSTPKPEPKSKRIERQSLQNEKAPAAKWSYRGRKGPNHWGQLSPRYRTCRTGSEQSPINIPSHWPTHRDMRFFYKETPFSLVNNGHTIKVNVPRGLTTYINGESFELKYWTFHSPSEHLVHGKAYPMEIHFVHQNSQGELAILAVFVKETTEPNAQHPTIDKLWRYLPERLNNPITPQNTLINPTTLFPDKRNVYRYHGSLTAPPCSEGVLWSLYSEPIELSMDQILRFQGFYPFNARPVQPLNYR